jgi:hypothetical protein
VPATDLSALLAKYPFKRQISRAPKTVSSPESLQKPPKIFIPTTIKKPKSWRGERGQLDKLEVVDKKSRLTQAAKAAFLISSSLTEETMIPECHHIKTSSGKCDSPTLDGTVSHLPEEKSLNQKNVEAAINRIKNLARINSPNPMKTRN